MTILDKTRYIIYHNMPAMIAFVILKILFIPIIAFGLSHFSGEIMAILFKDNIITGLNVIFDTSRFSLDTLPEVCGAMTAIGSFFCNRWSIAKPTRKEN